jgi:glycosyltransferase involved in cell wall biosynthesis
MRVLHLVSCRGWSSDAYWTARAARELARRGDEVAVGCRAGTEERVGSRLRAEGLERIVTFAFAGGLAPAADAADLRRLLAWLPRTDVVHVHRGKEHWLAAAANRLSRSPRPVVRTRHIAQAVRPHAANRWLYGRATALVLAVTEAIRRQYLAAGLVGPERVVTVHGGADGDTYAAGGADEHVRGALGGVPGAPLVGMVGGLRVMKGHRVVLDAVAALAAQGRRPRLAVVGQGGLQDALAEAIRAGGLGGHVTMTGFAADLPAVMRALDVALYVPLESDGMSRVLFEYLAAGRAVIASRVGAVPETLTDGEHALLVPAGDAPALAAALARLLDDAGLRARLGEAGRRLVLERYSGARLAATLETHYARLAAAS